MRSYNLRFSTEINGQEKRFKITVDARNAFEAFNKAKDELGDNAEICKCEFVSMVKENV